MTSLKLPFELGDLLLTPQWAGLHPGLQWGLLLAVVLVPLALILWLYRYELRLVPRLTATSLLTLRVTVLTLILLLVCLQPIYARTKTEGLPGRIVVAVDCSDSMQVADPQRAVVEKLKLARGLALAEGTCPDDLLAGWIADYEAKREPQWVKSDEERDRPDRRRELERQRRQMHDRVVARVDELTRAEAARRVLTDEGAHLLSALAAAGHKVELVGFHRDAWELQPGQVEELFQKAAQKKDATKPAPEGSSAPATSPASGYTDIGLPLARAQARSGVEKGDVLGIVLLSDGQHNTGASPVAKAKELGTAKVPVYAVALGAAEPPADAVVVAVRPSSQAIVKNDEVPVDVDFKITGLAPQDVLLELHRSVKGQKKLLSNRTLHHDGKDRAYTETFRVVMDEVGTQALIATVKPLGPLVKEARTDNNTRLTSLNVADDKSRVLLVDGEARWELHYLATALKRDRTMQVDTVVFQQPRLDSSRTPEELLKLGSPRQQLPAGPDALAEYDCIILGDVSPEQLPHAERLRLEKYVSDRGGTLVVLAGKRSLPMAFPEVEPTGEPDPLRKLLPIETPHVVAPRDGFHIPLTQAGRETKFMELGPDPARSEAIWAALQKHYWGVIGPAKPGATVLAGYTGPDRDKGPGDRDQPSALMAWQHYGFGRVLYIGLDSTWRWRFKVGDLYHHTFWGAAIRWAAADKALMSGNDYLRFGTPQPVYARDDEVKVVVRLNEAAGPLKPDLLAGARVLQLGTAGEKDKSVALVPLARREAQPRVLEGKVNGLPPGQYAVELVIPDLASKLRPPEGAPDRPLRAHFTVRMPDSPEMIDLATRWPLLEEIAAKTGGKVYSAAEARSLVELLAKKSVPHIERHEQRLWQWWVLLALVVALLTLEWVGRKLAGLP